jgi:hypothetical protein
MFNVSSILSNVLSTDDGKQVVMELVNYPAYQLLPRASKKTRGFTSPRKAAPAWISSAFPPAPGCV